MVLGEACLQQVEGREAELVLEAVLKRQEEVGREETADLARTLYLLGQAQGMLGKFLECEAVFTRSLRPGTSQ